MTISLEVPNGVILDESGNVDLFLFKRGTRIYTASTDSHGLLEYFEEIKPVDYQEITTFFTTHCPGVDPFSLAEKISKEDLHTVSLTDKFPKIELEELYRLIHLYQHYCKGLVKNTPKVAPKTQTFNANAYGSNLEVGTLLFYNPQLNKIKFVLPTQKVRPALWEWDISNKKPLVFIDPDLNKSDGSYYTLEEITALGWYLLGTSHSHNTIQSTWSGTDFEDQAGVKPNLKPPMLHVLAYGMADYQGEHLPSVSILPSVNSYGELLNFELEDIFTDSSELPYESVSWIGGEVAEKLATRFYAVPTVYSYKGKNNNNPTPYSIWSKQTNALPASTPSHNYDQYHPYSDPYYTSPNSLPVDFAEYYAALEKENSSRNKSTVSDSTLEIMIGLENDALDFLDSSELAELIGTLIDGLHEKQTNRSVESLFWDICSNSFCLSSVFSDKESVDAPK